MLQEVLEWNALGIHNKVRGRVEIVRAAVLIVALQHEAREG
jgi:hypothetical protein